MNYICKKFCGMIKIELNRVNGDYGFEASDAFGHTTSMDTSVETGGKNFGIRPMQMLLMGLGGCSGIDIVSILKKQRQEVTGFRMFIEGNRQQNKEPSLWENIHVRFELEGKIDPAKAHKACELSMDKYCSVAATLRDAGCLLTWNVQVK